MRRKHFFYYKSNLHKITIDETNQKDIFLYTAELQRRLRKKGIKITYKGVQYYLENCLSDQIKMKKIGSGSKPLLKLIS